MATDKLSNITANEVKAYHGISASDTSKDARIAVMLPLAVEWITNYCRQDFESKSRVEYPYIENRMNCFYTDYRPVASVTSVIENSITLTENTDFYVHKSTGKIERVINSSGVILDDRSYFGFWSTTPRSVVITYTGGEALPKDVVMVFYELVGVWAQLKTKTYVTGDGVEAVVTLTSLPDNLMQVLDRHKYYRI